MGFFLRLDATATNRMLTDVAGGSAYRAAERVRDRARQNLIRAGRVGTGRLLESIQVRESSPFEYTIGSPLPYASFQELGVRGPILPVRARVLRFKPKGSSSFIFRPRTRGFAGAFYMRDAYADLSPKDFVP